MGEDVSVLILGERGEAGTTAVERALDGLDVTVSADGTTSDHEGSYDCVVASADRAAALLATMSDDERSYILLTDGSRADAVDHERVRHHPASSLDTLEARVVDAVLADRERQRAAEQPSSAVTWESFDGERAYRTLVENLPDAGVSLFDRDLRYLWVGGGVFDVVDLGPDDVEGKLVDEVHSNLFIDQHRDAYEAAFDGERSSFEFGYDGEEFVAEVRPIYDGDDVVAGMTMTRRVTEERERERELLVKTQAMDNAGIGLCLTDPTRDDNPLVYVNEGYQEITGYDADEVLGKNPRHLQGPETEPEPNARMREAVENGEQCAVELTNYRKDGTPFVNHVEITPIFDDDGDLVHFLGSQIDVTERHERERALARQNERLEEFAGVVSHDLRGPISVVRGRVELAQQTGDLSHLEPVDRVLQRMDDLVDDVLTLAREGTNLDADRVEPVSIERVAHETWATVDTKGATLVVTDDVTVAADENRLRQLFENCVRNSVEHGSTGSRPRAGDSVEHGSTSARTETASGNSVEHCAADDAETPALTVRVGPLADDAGFFVEDDGVGLDEEAGDLFEAGVTTVEDGTGFGLAIVRTVAEAHGWTVTATESDEGGARFEVRTRQAGPGPG
jgi:PAS domain S-box-containing protein